MRDDHMESYDVFLSVGSDNVSCRPAGYLGYHNLRQYAAPLDWMQNYSLDTVIQLFQTSFSTFFANILEDGEYKGKHEDNRQVIDVTNHIISKHHFNKNIPLEDSQKEFVAKMRRRYTILDNKLKTSDTLMLIGSRGDDRKELESFLFRFSGLYTNLRITLMNIRNDSGMDHTDVYSKKYELSEKLAIVEYFFNDSSIPGEGYPWLGNDRIWNSILDNYCLTDNHAVENAFEKLKEKVAGRNAVLYGTGESGMELLHMLGRYGMKVKGFAVSDGRKKSSEYRGLPVSTIEGYSKDDVILIALRIQSESSAVRKTLLSKGYNNIVGLDYGTVPNIEDIQQIL